MKTEILKRTLKGLGLGLILIAGHACTDLEPQFTDSVSVESESGDFQGVTNSEAALESLYTGLRNLNGQDNEYALMTVSAAQVAVLTRGADWGDNGVWRQLHNHSWTPSQLYVLNSWNRRNQDVFNSTLLIDEASTKTPEELAQAQVIRAINAFMVLNFFGITPFRGVNDGPDVDPVVRSAQESYDAIIADLDAAINSGRLHTSGPAEIEDTFEIGEAAARFIRAKVKLNAEQILGAAPAGAYDDVIADVTAIENLGFELDQSDFT